MIHSHVTSRAWLCASVCSSVLIAVSAGGCAQVMQTALAVPMVAVKVAEVPLRHTQEMTRIAANAATDTTKTLVTESIRASTARQVAAENARAQVAIAQIQNQSQAQSQQAQSQGQSQARVQALPQPQIPSQAASTPLAAAPRTTSALPSMSVIDVQSRPAPSVAPVSSVSAQPLKQAQTVSKQPQVLTQSIRNEPSMSLDDLREAQRRAAMQRLAQMESRHNWY
jgi:hypothetical protein